MSENQPENKEDPQTETNNIPEKEGTIIQEKSQENKSNSFSIFIIIFGVILLSIIIFLIFGKKRKVVLFDNPIPYIFNKDFYETLTK